MAVFGVDLGNLCSKVSVVRKGGIDVIMNEVSKRETSSVVSFGEKERYLGEKGADHKIRAWRNTICHLKRLVGVKYGGPEWEMEARHCLFPTSADEDGFVQVTVEYDGNSVTFRPEQVIAMLLGKLRSYTEREATQDLHGVKVRVVDCVLAVPAWYSAFQRKLMLQATQIAGLNCLTLITEGTAACLEYGIYKNETFPEAESDGLVMLLVDIGHSQSSITATKFWKGNMKVLGHVYDKHLGCRDLDLALADNFRKEIEAKYKMDVYEQKRAKLRLVAGCEKLKTTLSANPVANMSVECIMNDTDVSFSAYTREEFEALIGPSLKQMEGLVQRALAIPGVCVDGKPNVADIELIGGGCRIPKLREILSNAFGMELRTTLNASEAIAKGCGIMGAMLHPKFQVKKFSIQDSVVHPVNIGWISDTDAPAILPDLKVNKEKTIMEANSHFPKMLDLTFERSSDFDLYAYYPQSCKEIQDSNGGLILGHWTFRDIPKPKDNPDAKVPVIIRMGLNNNGLLVVEAAFVKEEYEVEETVEKPVEKTEEKEGEEKKPATEKVVVKKKKERKVDITVQPHVILGIPENTVQDMAKLEVKMADADTLVQETLYAKNALEEYAYDYRSKVSEGGLLHDYLEPAERESFKQALQEAADWLYADGENETRDVYQKRLLELRKPGDAAQRRLQIREELPFALSEADSAIVKEMDNAQRLIESETHICKEKLGSVVTKAEEARSVLRNEKKKMEETPKHCDVNYTVAEARAKAREVSDYARPIFNTPKPEPPKEEKKEKADSQPASPSPARDEAKPAQQTGMDVD